MAFNDTKDLIIIPHYMRQSSGVWHQSSGPWKCWQAFHPVKLRTWLPKGQTKATQPKDCDKLITKNEGCGANEAWLRLYEVYINTIN